MYVLEKYYVGNLCFVYMLKGKDEIVDFFEYKENFFSLFWLYQFYRVERVYRGVCREVGVQIGNYLGMVYFVVIFIRFSFFIQYYMWYLESYIQRNFLVGLVGI